MADVIYPAAFHGTHAHRGVAPALPVMAATAKTTRKATPGPMAGGAIGGLRTAAAESLEQLHRTHDEAEAIDRLGDALRHEAADVEDARRDLSYQMDRLIAETRRMTAYLRGQG